jgi:hypothetical protein
MREVVTGTSAVLVVASSHCWRLAIGLSLSVERFDAIRFFE